MPPCSPSSRVYTLATSVRLLRNISPKTKPMPQLKRAPRKACDACHAIKTRCIPGHDSDCQRCARLEIRCKHSNRTPRRKKSQSDSSSFSLGKDVDQRRESFSEMKNNIPLSPRQYEVAHQLPPELAINALSAFQADRLLQMYIDNYVPRWPVVLLPDANHEDLSRRRPLRC